MFYILVMSFFFIFSVSIHLIFCRHRRSKGLLVKQFCIIAMLNLFFGCVIFFLLGKSMAQDSPSIWNLPLSMTSSFIYILLVPTYMVFYTSTQLNSPSKKILLLLQKNGPMSFEELLKHFTEEEFIMPRVMDLQHTGCIQCAQGHWLLLPPGLSIARFLNIYQRILDRRAGG